MDKWDAYDLSSFGLYLSKKYPFKVEIPYDGTQLKSSNIALFLTKFNEFYKNCKAENFIKKHNSDFNKITGYAEKVIIESDVFKCCRKIL